MEKFYSIQCESNSKLYLNQPYLYYYSYEGSHVAFIFDENNNVYEYWVSRYVKPNLETILTNKIKYGCYVICKDTIRISYCDSSNYNNKVHFSSNLCMSGLIMNSPKTEYKKDSAKNYFEETPYITLENWRETRDFKLMK